MNIDQAFLYIESFTNLEKTPGTSMRPYRLNRMKALLEMFENPQNRLKTVHISGSKGKGSTGVYIASVLREAGFTTGLYTSPHVSSYKERITVAGREIDDGPIVTQAMRIRDLIESTDPLPLPGKSEPTTFELLTLLAYLVFAEIGCTWAVIETGIGGRLDATNILMPRATVHTLVEFEHTEILGNTIAEIAYEKAGIMKPGIPAFCGPQRPDAEDVFRRRADKISAPIFFAKDRIKSMRVSGDSAGLFVDVETAEGESVHLKPGMPGAFQADNAVLAYLVADHLLQSEGTAAVARKRALIEGIGLGKLPGRMELICAEPPVMLDAAHTASSAQRLLEAYKEIYSETGVLIFGSVLGKDVRSMAEILAPAFKNVIISTPGTFKQSDPEGVYREFKAINDNTELILNPSEAYQRALSISRDTFPILITGSFYMIGEIRPLETEQAGVQ